MEVWFSTTYNVIGGWLSLMNVRQIVHHFIRLKSALNVYPSKQEKFKEKSK